MSIGTLIGIAASASVLAHSAATKRGRNPQVWSVVAFLFPIALVVLWCLSPRPTTAAATPGPAAAAKVPAASSGWADSAAPTAEQHSATSERGMSASLLESW
ncbi:MAG TPA: hypothetical protein VHX15_06775 [Frankiaceae bacterium]|jgi:predicted MFS family arabinose efflux permease|nr:hypothetical protein [Frankiaceae bacterium]